MTTPMVDTVRTIPLEKEFREPMEAENENSGFPFDREERDDDFRSQLDDIAKRHPEFAEHFEGFPFRSETLGRRRPPRPSDSEFRRFTDRPFGSSRFERFGFPFTADPFEEDFQEQKPAQTPPQQEQPPQQQPAEDRPKPERGRKNIQQSNTVDLGQKQEPVNDRNQRSMSAPPPDNKQRYVSSIHIPINKEGRMGDMGNAQAQPQPANKPTERVIPIHVEGRDEPVMPKHTGPSFSQQQQPQPERIFGHSPSHFTQFVGREQPRQYAAGPEWHHNFPPQQKFQQQGQWEIPVQREHVPQQQQQPPQAQQQQQQHQQQQQQQQHQQQQQQPQQQQPQQQQQQQQQPPKPSTPIGIIQNIQKDVSELMGQVEKFNGVPKDKQYLYLDEMLTRNLIKLDNIDTQGQENIRQARKEAIKCIESCIGILEAKAAANVVPQEKKPEETKTEEPQPKEESQKVEEKMEVESEAKPEDKVEEVAKVEKAPKEIVEVAAPTAPEEKMDVGEAAPVEEKKEEKPKEGESKPDEEMKEVPEEKKEEPKEEVKEETKESTEQTSEDKDKKKGKKKVVKK